MSTLGVPAGAGRRRRSATPLLTAAGVGFLGYLVLTAGFLAFGMLVTDVLFDGPIGAWERDISRWLVGHRSPTADDLSFLGSTLAHGVVIVGIGLVVVITLVRRHDWGHAGLLVIGLLVEVSVFSTVAFVIGRDRPDVVRLESLPTDSFPSGHTSAAATLYIGIAIIVTQLGAGRWARRAAWTVAVALPLVVATSRMYRGVHYVTDVLAGTLLGVASLGVAMLAVRWAGQAPRPDDDVEEETGTVEAQGWHRESTRP